jgi:hypothetical protein
LTVHPFHGVHGQRKGCSVVVGALMP